MTCTDCHGQLLRLTNGKPALARWIGDVETEFG